MFGPIPDFQPIPFPAPLWLLQILLVGGFYLHALPMNVALMGGFVSVGFLVAGKRQNNEFATRIGKVLAFSLPFFVSVAITQGIVPLLFLQLVYGPLFYTSSILMGMPWISVIFLLLIAYYAYYVYTYRRDTLGKRAPWVLVGAGLLFMTVAFMFTNNTTLMLVPQKWLALYHNSASGLNLNVDDPQVIPRYLHFMIAALAVTSLAVGCFGLYWYPRQKDYGQWLLRTSAGLFIVFTLFQLPVGIWFLLSLPDAVMWNFLGEDITGTAVFFSSLGLDVVALIAMALAWKNATPGPFRVGLATTLVIILLMVIVRHLVRVYSTQAFFQPERVPVETQPILLTLFLVSFVIGLIYIAWLLKITWDAYHQPPRPNQDEPLASP
jgi:hypothetical protein